MKCDKARAQQNEFLRAYVERKGSNGQHANRAIHVMQTHACTKLESNILLDSNQPNYLISDPAAGAQAIRIQRFSET
jgi:hypothetical protein